MAQVESDIPNENLKNNAEAEYTSKDVTKMAAPNTGSALLHQHHSSQNPQRQQQQHTENRESSHHHHSRREVTSNNVVGNHFKIGRRIGEGSFGIIYDGIDTQTNKHVAIKYESKKSEAPQLRDEFRTYKLLQGFTGIPNAYYFGSESMYNILVIDLLGPSLEDLFDTCNRKFSVKTVCMAAKQMLCRVQSVHEKSLVYRDIKPDNFLVGRIPPYVDSNSSSDIDVNSILKNHSKEHPHTASQIYLIDFGMAKFYRDPKTLQHIPYKEKRSLSGTARYMSINTHLGREQSRRDDLEGLGHVLMYFLRGSLPWQGMKAATNKQKYEKIGEKKRTTSIKELCDGFPEEFAIYMNYVRKLGFEETPDYDYLRGLFDKVLKRMGEEEDNVFDWMLKLEEQRKEITRLHEKQKSTANCSSQVKEQQKEKEKEVKEQKASNASVPVINESTTQNASMQVLRGGGGSVDEMTNKSHSQHASEENNNIINHHTQINNTTNVNSPLYNEIKMEDNDEDEQKEDDKEEQQDKKVESSDETAKEEVQETKEEEEEEVKEEKKEEVKNEPTETQPEPTKAAEPENTSEPVAKPEPVEEQKTEIKQEPVTTEPAVTPEPTPAAAATATTPENNNETPKKKSGGFLGIFSCCMSSSN